MGGEYAEMMQCGQPRIVATPDRPSPAYCAAHAKAAYQPQPARRAANAAAVSRQVRPYW